LPLVVVVSPPPPPLLLLALLTDLPLPLTLLSLQMLPPPFLLRSSVT
jgi:hypothetical protein